MTPPADNEGPTGETPLADTGSDRCGRCGAPLATDQRYCVNCGERRGRPRFGSAPAAAITAAAPAPVLPAPVARARFSPGTTLVAGVATLLLAMGVGVLIGENGANANGRQVADAPIIKVNSGGSGVAGTTASSSTTTSKTTKHSGKSSTHSSSNNTGPAKVVHLTKKVTSQITKATSNVIGTSAKLAPPTTQLGGKCTDGQAGCQGGKFTGNFFSNGG